MQCSNTYYKCESEFSFCDARAIVMKFCIVVVKDTEKGIEYITSSHCERNRGQRLVVQ